MDLKTVLIAPDKFKGSLTAKRFCEIAEEEIKKYNKNVQVITSPLADGGEGTLSCIANNLNAKLIQKKFSNANFEKKTASYAIKDNIAFIEIAETCGLVNTKIKNPSITTTIGVGEQIVDAINAGATKIYLTLGGSSTNDAGCGMAAGVGYKFFNKAGKEFLPTGSTLSQISRIEFPKEKIKAEIIALCDVKNVLFGKNGAAYVYAKQKGATNEDLKILDDNLKTFNLICKKYGYNFENVEGAGAAGGLGAGAIFFLNAKLESGIDTIFKLVDIDNKISKADLIISGEGKIDEQSKFGKVVFSLKEKCANKNFVAFCGENKLKENPFQIIEINNKNSSLEENIKNTENNLRNSIKEYLNGLY